MSDQFVETFVDKLILLEQKTGSKVQYRIMGPITMTAYDHLELQAVANKIAEFIGLTGFTFILLSPNRRRESEATSISQPEARRSTLKWTPTCGNFPMR